MAKPHQFQIRELKRKEGPVRDDISDIRSGSNMVLTAIATRTLYRGLTIVYFPLSAMMQLSQTSILLKYTRRAKNLEHSEDIRLTVSVNVRQTHNCAVNIGNA